MSNDSNSPIHKSSRHSEIIGQLGEVLICNWLSRSGFETSIIDHTGIDIIAYNSKTDRRFGISVKARTRVKGTERDHVTLLDDKKNDRKKLLDACRAFSCDPWVGIYLEATDHADMYLVSLKHYEETYGSQGTKRLLKWKMDRKTTDE